MKNIIISMTTAALLLAGFGVQAELRSDLNKLSGDDKEVLLNLGAECLESYGISAEKIKDKGADFVKKFIMDNQPTKKMSD